MQRRRILTFALCLIALSEDARSQEVDEEGKKLGDKGFMHKWLHSHYQKYLSTITCPCQDGECRPTRWRRDPRDARIIQVWLDGHWESEDSKTLVKDKHDIPKDFPPELRKYTAHACAYGVHPNVTVTCIWIMDAGV